MHNLTKGYKQVLLKKEKRNIKNFGGDIVCSVRILILFVLWQSEII